MAEPKVLDKKIKHIDSDKGPNSEDIGLKPIPGLKFVRELEDVNVNVCVLFFAF